VIFSLLLSSFALTVFGPDSDALESRPAISVDVELRDESPACESADESCTDTDLIIRLDADAFRYTVKPALQAAGWELIGLTDTVHGGSLSETYVRVHSRSPYGHTTCADRLVAWHSASSDAQLTVQFAQCED
jgi:hypothetical protein